MNRLKEIWETHGADLSMTLMIFIWGLHFIVVKDGLSDFAPLTFNAIRFSLAAPILILVAWRILPKMRLSRRDFLLILFLGLMGPATYQIVFVLGLERTTSTNTALLVTTMPTWTALISVTTGLVALRRMLLVGIAITLTGITLVILSRAEEGLSLSKDDLVGSGLLLWGAIMMAVFVILSKPLVDRYGGMPIGIWTHWITCIALIILAAPDMVKLQADDFPLRVAPHLIYSGVLSSAGGYLALNNAVQKLGSTRASTYNNFVPLVTAVASVFILHESLTAGLILGGILTLAGVGLVRLNTKTGARIIHSTQLSPKLASAASSCGD